MDGSKQWQENLRHLSTKNFELNFEATTIKSRRKGIDPGRFPLEREKGERELVCVFSFDASERRWRKERGKEKCDEEKYFYKNESFPGFEKERKDPMLPSIYSSAIY